jgi:hypothetical protein
MRIERLEARLVNVPLRTERRTSFSTRRAMTQRLVRATHLGDDVLAGGPLISGGRPLRVPDAPGLGAPVSEAKVRELEERFRIDGNATAFSWTKGDST